MTTNAGWPIGVCPSLAVMASNGCGFGPRAMERTHARYSNALRRIDHEERLANTIRLRFVEIPQDLDVSSIVAQYELSAAAELRPFFTSEGVSGPDFR